MLAKRPGRFPPGKPGPMLCGTAAHNRQTGNFSAILMLFNVFLTGWWWWCWWGCLWCGYPSWTPLKAVSCGSTGRCWCRRWGPHGPWFLFLASCGREPRNPWVPSLHSKGWGGGGGAESGEKKYPLPQRSLHTKARTLCPGTTATLALCKTQTLSDCKNTLSLCRKTLPLWKNTITVQENTVFLQEHSALCKDTLSFVRTLSFHLQGHPGLCENAFLSSARTPWPLWERFPFICKDTLAFVRTLSFHLQGHAVLCENAFFSSARTPWPLWERFPFIYKDTLAFVRTLPLDLQGHTVPKFVWTLCPWGKTQQESRILICPL